MLKIAKIFLLSFIASITLYGCACQPQSKWIDAPKNTNTKETVQETKVEQSYSATVVVYFVNEKTKKQKLLYSEKYDSIQDGVNQQITYGKQMYSYDKTKEFIFLDDNIILDGKVLIINDKDKIRIGSSTNLTSEGALKTEHNAKKELFISAPMIHSQVKLKEVNSFPYEEKIVLDNYQIMLTVQKK